MQTKIPLQSYKTKLKIQIDPGLVKPCFEKPGPGNYRAQSIFFQLFSFKSIFNHQDVATGHLNYVTASLSSSHCTVD